MHLDITTVLIRLFEILYETLLKYKESLLLGRPIQALTLCLGRLLKTPIPPQRESEMYLTGILELLWFWTPVWEIFKDGLWIVAVSFNTYW